MPSTFFWRYPLPRHVGSPFFVHWSGHETALRPAPVRGCNRITRNPAQQTPSVAGDSNPRKQTRLGVAHLNLYIHPGGGKRCYFGRPVAPATATLLRARPRPQQISNALLPKVCARACVCVCVSFLQGSRHVSQTGALLERAKKRQDIQKMSNQRPRKEGRVGEVPTKAPRAYAILS